ncbi:hypothetical protein ACP70R_044436 [Stipagrostis hirtigluma subsp. patula]
MAMLAMMRLMAMRRRRRRRRRIHARNGPIASVAARKGSPGEQDANPRGGKTTIYSGPNLPEDILHRIHSLLPLRDAARAACVSHAFLNSWRCRPNLYFSMEALGLKGILYGNDQIARGFTRNVDQILKKHPGTGLKTFGLAMNDCSTVKSCHIDSWLQFALTSGTEELNLAFASSGMAPMYNFPCSLLSGDSGNSIRCLRLSFCAFRLTARLCLRNLKRLHLYWVNITGDELGCLLCNSFALEQLELIYCMEIICLKIPRLLLRLSYLKVFSLASLQVIESEAPNLSSFVFANFNHRHIQLSLGEALQVKKLDMSCSCAIYYAREDLPTMVPNLETLCIDSHYETVNTAMVPSKLRHLKYLDIRLPGPKPEYRPDYDYFSLVSFLDASPSLETFILRIHVPEVRVEHGLFSGDPSHLLQMPGHHHDNLKRVTIAGFYPAKSLLELACYVLQCTTSLECLTLGTSYCSCWRHDSDPGKCFLLAIRTYFKGKVPSTARLDVQGPCSGVVVDFRRQGTITVFKGESLDGLSSVP